MFAVAYIYVCVYIYTYICILMVYSMGLEGVATSELRGLRIV